MTGRRNLAASVRQRLTNRARQRGEDVELVFIRYALERLLYRLGRSDQRERFILKGAMLFALWSGEPYRATRDLDLLGLGDSGADVIRAAVRSLCELPVEEDGIGYAADGIRVESTADEEGYPVVRVRLNASLAGARIPVHVDIGFGDVVTPAAKEMDYPTLLDLPAPRIFAYPRETVVAEKYEAIVSLGMFNSRMKDFYDLWVLASSYPFEAATLATSITGTFRRRGTGLGVEIPVGLSEEFANDPLKRQQWDAFIGRSRLTLKPPSLVDVVAFLATFLLPPVERLRHDPSPDLRWPPGGPWQ